MKSQEDSLHRIRHVVVLMLENRSFDNLLGWLYEDGAPRGQKFEGLSKEMWNPLSNFDSDGVPFVENVPVRKNGEVYKIHGHQKNPERFDLPHPDPGEGFRDTNHQLFQAYDVPDLYPPPTNQGFVDNYKSAMLYGTFSYGDHPTDPREIMITYGPEQLPVLSKLARKFAVCDQWFASVPSQTLPNRAFVHAAQSCGNVNNYPQALCNARTIYQQIQDAIDAGQDLTWGVFSDNVANERTRKREPGGREKNPKYFSLTRAVMTQLHPAKFHDNFRTMDHFLSQLEEGKLPSYSFLEPQFSGDDQSDQHPPSDIRSGDALIARIYETLRASDRWHDTLFIITYDEHGGCYDHVSPPGHAVPPDPARPIGQDGFRFDRFGVRVPTVLVSPYIEEGTVCRPDGWTPFDHTSIIKTVQRCLRLEGHLTERDKAAPDVGCALTLDTPRTDKVEVSPMPLPGKKTALPENDLHRVFAFAMCTLMGLPLPAAGEAMWSALDSFTGHFGEPPA